MCLAGNKYNLSTWRHIAMPMINAWQRLRSDSWKGGLYFYEDNWIDLSKLWPIDFWSIETGSIYKGRSEVFALNQAKLRTQFILYDSVGLIAGHHKDVHWLGIHRPDVTLWSTYHRICGNVQLLIHHVVPSLFAYISCLNKAWDHIDAIRGGARNYVRRPSIRSIGCLSSRASLQYNDRKSKEEMSRHGTLSYLFYRAGVYRNSDTLAIQHRQAFARGQYTPVSETVFSKSASNHT